MRPSKTTLTTILIAAATAGTMVSAQSTSAGGGASVGNGGTLARKLSFSPATFQAGLGGTNLVGNSHTGGIAWVDYDGDLWPDLVISNGSGTEHYLFRNEGDGTFTDVSSLIAKPDVSLEDAGVKYADVDNDGDEDLFFPVDSPATVIPAQPVNPPEGGPNLFYRNQGDGTFVEEAALVGLVHPLGRRTITAGFADWDRDGFVDLYQGSWTMYGLPLGVHDDFDRLYQNDGTGSFVDVTSTTGVDGYGLDVLTSIWVDVDNDRWPDLYVANTAHTDSPPLFVTQDAFYRNSGGTAFTDDFAVPAGLGDDAYAPMGMDIGDIDNDGDWDLYFTDNLANPPNPRGNVLYLGDGAGGFSDNTVDLAGVAADDSWPCGFGDFDLDGLVDLWVGSTSPSVPEFFYMNNGDGTFRLVDNTGVIGNTAKGGALADYDGDGDLDVAIWELGPALRLYRNDTLSKGNFIQFKLYGTDSNRSAIGAVVKVTSNGVTQMRRVSGGDSAHSQQEAILTFGVGNATSVQVTVEWPSGADQVFPLVATNALVLVDEDAGILGPEVNDDGSGYDPASRTLLVRVRSNYGARTALQVPGRGPLTYDPELRAHVGRFAVQAAVPTHVEVQDGAGRRWRVDVQP